jgi:hypothetical protein
MTTTKQNNGRGQAGIGVDSRGGAVIDPTANVLALSHASDKRQDDLREAASLQHKTEMHSLEQLMELRAKHRTEVDSLRDGYEDKLRTAESKRIDAIRAVDVNAVSVASQRASDQASVLAAQVAQSADALRTLVASTASTVAQAQSQLGTGLSERITKLEQAQYTGAGKQSVSDPAMLELVKSVNTLVSNQQLGSGRAQGISTVGAAIIGVAIFASAVFGVVTFVGRTTTPAQVVAPTTPPIVIQLPSGTTVK